MGSGQLLSRARALAVGWKQVCWEGLIYTTSTNRYTGQIIVIIYTDYLHRYTGHIKEITIQILCTDVQATS